MTQYCIGNFKCGTRLPQDLLVPVRFSFCCLLLDGGLAHWETLFPLFETCYFSDSRDQNDYLIVTRVTDDTGNLFLYRRWIVWNFNVTRRLLYVLTCSHQRFDIDDIFTNKWTKKQRYILHIACIEALNKVFKNTIETYFESFLCK